jgi:preprotein translocase subunit Sss1
MERRIISKQRVVKFCESCAYILGQTFVVALGFVVVGALGFAIYQAVRSLLG